MYILAVFLPIPFYTVFSMLCWKTCVPMKFAGKIIHRDLHPSQVYRDVNGYVMYIWKKKHTEKKREPKWLS